MNHHSEVDLDELADQWRARAKKFMQEAERGRGPAETIRLTAMASTLEWAASDLAWVTRSPRPPSPSNSNPPSGARTSEH
jgi:hypothetical protein